jgi:hypothetical protein
MTTAVVASPENDQALAWPPLVAFVIKGGSAPAVETVALKMALPVSSVDSPRRDVRPERRPGSLFSRWVPDPHGESGLICTWVPDPAEMSVSSNA